MEMFENTFQEYLDNYILPLFNLEYCDNANVGNVDQSEQQSLQHPVSCSPPVSPSVILLLLHTVILFTTHVIL